MSTQHGAAEMQLCVSSKRNTKQNLMIIFFINSHPYLHWYFTFFFFLNFSITVWLVFPSSERIKSSHPSHDLERVYKYPTFNYTWSYIKKKIQTGHTPEGYMLGCLLSKRKKEKRQPLKRKQKEIKEYTLQELANKSIKCLSRCYCGMSVGFHFLCNRGGLLCQEESPTPPPHLEGQRWYKSPQLDPLLQSTVGSRWSTGRGADLAKIK